MDHKQLDNAVTCLTEMITQYQNLSKLEPVLQEAVKESMLQRFEYTLEVAWKTAKKYLTEIEGYPNDMGPNTVIRICGEMDILNSENWLYYLKARQAVSHDYCGTKAAEVLESAVSFHSEVQRFIRILDKKLTEAGNRL